MARYAWYEHKLRGRAGSQRVVLHESLPALASLSAAAILVETGRVALTEDVCLVEPQSMGPFLYLSPLPVAVVYNRLCCTQHLPSSHVGGTFLGGSNVGDRALEVTAMTAAEADYCSLGPTPCLHLFSDRQATVQVQQQTVCPVPPHPPSPIDVPFCADARTHSLVLHHPPAVLLFSC